MDTTAPAMLKLKKATYFVSSINDEFDDVVKGHSVVVGARLVIHDADTYWLWWIFQFMDTFNAIEAGYLSVLSIRLNGLKVVCSYYWPANSILGLAFGIQGIEMLSLESFMTGARCHSFVGTFSV
ncbi:hypothetical protein Tco_1104559 [Tanacetum coccineum]